jgi:uncharacterized protein (TIGR03067 family)
MRLLTFLSLALLGLGCAGTKNSSMDPNALYGVWVPVRQEMGGKALPKAIYEQQKLILSDSSYTVVAESVDKGIVIYGDHTMDIYGKEGVNAGKHFTARYAYEEGMLTICYDLSGKGYPENFATSGKPLYFLSIFKK